MAVTAANKVKYGLKNVHVAKLTEDAEGNITYTAPRKVPGAVALSLPPVGEKTAFYADDVEYFTSFQNNGYEGTLEIAIVPDWFNEEIMLEKKDENEVYTENANTQPERFALLFEFDGDAKKTRHVMYNCKAQRANVESNTKTNNAEPKTESLPVVVKPLPDGSVKARTTANTPELAYNNWFKEVYGHGAAAIKKGV